jgi:hypothetical protein
MADHVEQSVDISKVAHVSKVTENPKVADVAKAADIWKVSYVSIVTKNSKAFDVLTADHV